MDAAAGGARVFVPGQGRRLKRRRTASSGGHIVELSLAPLSAAPDVELSRTPPRRWGRTHDQAITDAAMRGTGYCCTTADTAMICTRYRAIAGATVGYGCASLHVPSGGVRYQTITSGPAPIYFSGRSVAPPWTACALTMLSWTPRRAGCATELSRGPPPRAASHFQSFNAGPLGVARGHSAAAAASMGCVGHHYAVMDAASSGAHCRTIASAAAASGSSLSYFSERRFAWRAFSN